MPIQNLVKLELFYLLEIWRYEQNKGAEHKKKDPALTNRSAPHNILEHDCLWDRVEQHRDRLSSRSVGARLHLDQQGSKCWLEAS